MAKRVPKRKLVEGDPETVAILRVLAILATLDPEGRLRAARYVLARVEAEVTRDLQAQVERSQGVAGADPKSGPGDDD